MANHRAPKRAASRNGRSHDAQASAAPVVPAPAPASTPGKRKAVKPSRSSRGARTLPRRSQTSAPAALEPTAPLRPQTPTPLDAPAAAPEPSAPLGPQPLAPVTAAVTTPEPFTPPRRQTPAPASQSSAPARPRTPNPVAVFEKPRTAKPSTPVSQASGQAGARRNVFPLLPSAPAAVGAAALVIAATGAVTFTHSPGDLAASSTLIQPASALTGTSAETSSLDLDSRSQAVSRDSERAALQDAADQKLQQAAEAQAQQRNAALAQLAASAEKYAGQIAANAWHLPVAPGAYHLTAGFGESSGLWAHLHTGLDFAAPTGTPVMAVANGTITSAGWAGAYGNRIVVTHQDGTETWYCHLSAFKVSVGESVTGGEEIGLVGATGNVTGPHLHLEVRPGAGDPVDPYTALMAHGLHP